MRRFAPLLVLVGLVGLGGCAGALSALTDPPISSDKLDEPDEMNKLKTLSGDRRLVRVAADVEQAVYIDARGRRFYAYDVCAETQADAITTRGGSSSLTVEGQPGFTDASTQASTQTNTRGIVSDVVRQLSWQLCNARMNHDLNDKQYAVALMDLMYNTMAVLQQTAMGANSRAIPLRGAPAERAATTPPVSTPAPAPVTTGLPVTTTTTTTTKVGS